MKSSLSPAMKHAGGIASGASTGPSSGSAPRNIKGSSLTFAVLYAVCLIEGADIQLLPASFRSLEVSIGLTPSHLALLGMCQSITQWMCSPVWGSLVDSGWSRRRLLAGGACTWGILTILLGLTTHFPTMMLLRLMNGAALGTLSPISQSLIIDLTTKSTRGYYFGWVQMCANVGNIAAGIATATISNMIFWGRVEGWRVAFIAVGMISWWIALSVWLLMPEPHRPTSAPAPSASTELKKLRKYLEIPTFQVIVAQGIFGTIPWSSLNFLIFYFQYVGISDFSASTLGAASLAGGALGGIFGGLVADQLSRWSPYHGRPFAAQISVASGIPTLAMILVGLPRDPAYYSYYLCLVFIFGLMASWCAAGVNRPILAEIVEEGDRASVFSWMVSIDGAFGAMLGAPMVGLLAERIFGYSPSRAPVADMAPAAKAANCDALAKALLMCSAVPWMLCFICYGILHWTYSRDVVHTDDDARDTAIRETTSLLH